MDQLHLGIKPLQFCTVMNLLRGTRLALSAPASPQLAKQPIVMVERIQVGDIVSQNRMAPPHCSSGAPPTIIIVRKLLEIKRS